MRVVITRTDIVEIEPIDGVGPVDSSVEEQLEAFRDSFTSHVMDLQDATQETSDEKFTFIEREQAGLHIELAPAAEDFEQVDHEG